MRTASICVVGFLAVHISTICFGQSADPPASLPVIMTAEDATYTVRLPVGWQPAVKPMLEYGLVFGQQGESFAMGLEDVYLNPRMLWSILEPGYRAILPPAQFTLKSRMSAPPMGPLEVVTRLLPQLAAGSIQNVRVLHAFRGREDFGFRQMLVIYQYTFLPQRDWAFAAQANPSVRVMRQVQMEAAAYVVTFPYTAGQFSWQFGYRILSAPDSVFQRNAGTYAQILANLIGFIASRGGHVVGATVLTGKPYSASWLPTTRSFKRHEKSMGHDLEEWWRQAFGFGYDSLRRSSCACSAHFVDNTAGS